MSRQLLLLRRLPMSLRLLLLRQQSLSLRLLLLQQQSLSLRLLLQRQQSLSRQLLLLQQQSLSLRLLLRRRPSLSLLQLRRRLLWHAKGLLPVAVLVLRVLTVPKITKTTCVVQLRASVEEPQALAGLILAVLLACLPRCACLEHVYAQTLMMRVVQVCVRAAPPSIRFVSLGRAHVHPSPQVVAAVTRDVVFARNVQEWTRAFLGNVNPRPASLHAHKMRLVKMEFA